MIAGSLSFLEAAQIGDCSWATLGSSVPAVRRPRLADKATDSDDRVGEVEERVDDDFPPLVTALESVEGVVPGVRPLDVPALARLDRGLISLMRDLAAQVAAGQLVTSALGVIARIEVDG